MQIDPARVVGAVTREVASRMHEGQMARVAVATRAYDTDPADLWDAITSAERIPRWFMPISGELRLGGRYQLEGNAGGTITGCEPPEHLALTWEFGGQTSWVDVRLHAEGEGTRLVLEHVAHVPEEWWDQYGPGATGVGWDLALMGLELYLASGVPNDPKAAEAWLTGTPEGRGLVRRMSEAWVGASIASGTDAAAARAAGDRTTAFYTGA
jgi:uncharacterized protein YndB with AHSA1/START domain